MKLLRSLNSPLPTPYTARPAKRNLQFSPQMTFWLLPSRVQAAYSFENQI